MIERDELAAWLRLAHTPGVGRAAARRLLAAFASAEGIFAASRQAHGEVVAPQVVQALHAAPAKLERTVEATLQWLGTSHGEAPRGLVLLGDDDYPALLLETSDPPLLLYLEGNRRLLAADSVAVVGSRNPTPQGTENARAFAAQLSRSGYAIVSGLALGIDAAAHRGGLEGSGSSVAVVGTGLDRVYPDRHQELARQLARDGLMVSEFALGTPPLAAQFPQRNRLIAGLSLGTLVVEAALQSGSLITARMAVEAGRDVFAIPGSIHSPQSRGCHQLIKQGAQLVDSVGDILDALPPRASGPQRLAGTEGAAVAVAASSSAATGAQDRLLEALGHEPASIEALIARTGCSAAELNARLLELELVGQVARLPGQLFQRMARS